ncbi:hypothetical protein Tco_0585658 [Tanacetum coccineum]
MGIDRLAQNLCGHHSNPAKDLQWQEGCSQKTDIGLPKRTDFDHGAPSDADVPRTFLRSDDKFSQMLNQFESQPEYGGGSGSGGCGDDEPGDDEDDGEDEDDS